MKKKLATGEKKKKKKMMMMMMTMMMLMMMGLPFLYIQTPDKPPKRPDVNLRGFGKQALFPEKAWRRQGPI